MILVTGLIQSDPMMKDDNFFISIFTDSTTEADRLFQELSEDGKIMMPLSKTFRGAYFGMFTDKFGINWMINVDLKENK